MDLRAREESAQTVLHGCSSEVLARIHPLKTLLKMEERKIHQITREGKSGEGKNKIAK
jgi:hypothetical protein